MGYEMQIIKEQSDRNAEFPDGLRTSISQYFDEGRIAAETGKTAIVNPYLFDETTNRLDAWFDGYYHFHRTNRT
jgi:hypothetical protein